MSDQEPILTNRQGHPIRDNQNTITVGPKGPATLENYNAIEKLAHFDRERVPERVVHARGASAHGFFEAYGTIGEEPASKYSRAKLLQTKGKQTPVFVRFSTVIHSKDSPETLRDPRGFAVKFYTEDGNWDLVGNNLRVFFIRDAIKFPDFIHSFKPDPINNAQDPNRQFDFISQTPESIHMITLLFSPRGIPANYREQEGAGVNTYKLVNDKGEAVLVKFLWIPKQGVRSLTTPEAAEIQKEEFGHATKDLYAAIDRGDFPEWEFNVQMMSDGEHPELDFDPLDDTKQWPEAQFPLHKVGRMVLNKKPENFFAESEQSAFGTGVKVDGIEFSADKMLQGRTFSYSDTQRYRVGPNYQQLPINAAKTAVHTNQRDGAMTRVQDAGGANPHVNYEPSILGGVKEAPNDVTEYRPLVQGEVGRFVEDRTGDDYKQAGEIYRAFDDRHRDDLIENLVTNLKKADARIQERMVWHFLQADEDYGTRVAQGLGIAVDAARELPPLSGKPAPGSNRSATDNVPGVTANGKPYQATQTSGTGSGPATNGNVAVLQRVFSLAEATGAR